MRNAIGRRLLTAGALVTVAAGMASGGPAPECHSAAPPSFDDKTVVLFDGSPWDGWVQRDGSPSQWVVQDDGSVLAAGGDAITKMEFLDFQLHLEFLCPLMEQKTGQARANSGVYLHGRYEIQVLDSFGRPPEIDGCGALYGIAPPLVNASRPPGQWQSYDIVFQGPRYGPRDELLSLPRVTVLHNGIAIHNHREVPRITRAALPGGFMRTMGPIMLQYHGDPVRYRNIWVRRLN
ncbi:MAG: 3-keto-disaccharide hydrolase [Planctomycetota bacterium]|jgi:hypothetical protein